MNKNKKNALIIGAGAGISGAFAKELFKNGYRICLASRNIKNFETTAKEISAISLQVDCLQEKSIKNLFENFEKEIGIPSVILYNPSSRVRGNIHEIEISQAKAALNINVFGAFVAAQEAAKRMIPQKKGAIFFTGATASIKGFSGSSVFAMGKFALRGLAQSLYRELSPLGIHVAHFIIDGVVKKTFSADNSENLTSFAIAKTYMSVLNQPRQAWSHEIELRSFTEKF